MNEFKKILSFLIILIIITSCGYEIDNNVTPNSFSFGEIITTGDKRINYKIKNRLLFETAKNKSKIISLKIDTKKLRSTKNKNIKNEITKQELRIISQVNFKILGETNDGSFKVEEVGNFNVSNNKLNTLNNEKIMTNSLTDQIIQRISNKLNILINDN